MGQLWLVSWILNNFRIITIIVDNQRVNYYQINCCGYVESCGFVDHEGDLVEMDAVSELTPPGAIIWYVSFLSVLKKTYSSCLPMSLTMHNVQRLKNSKSSTYISSLKLIQGAQCHNSFLTSQILKHAENRYWLGY